LNTEALKRLEIEYRGCRALNLNRGPWRLKLNTEALKSLEIEYRGSEEAAEL
jgi:hypothetical protein